MKKILYILVALAVLAGCDKEGKENKLMAQIAGEWHCSPSDIEADIYLSFNAKGTFELYQKITSGAYRLYRGTWTADEQQKVMTGKYNDGEDWASDYIIALSGDLNSMTMQPTATTDLIEYVCTRESIPASVKENCEIKVKSPYAY